MFLMKAIIFFSPMFLLQLLYFICSSCVILPCPRLGLSPSAATLLPPLFSVFSPLSTTSSSLPLPLILHFLLSSISSRSPLPLVLHFLLSNILPSFLPHLILSWLCCIHDPLYVREVTTYVDTAATGTVSRELAMRVNDHVGSPHMFVTGRQRWHSLQYLSPDIREGTWNKWAAQAYNIVLKGHFYGHSLQHKT